MLSRLALLLVLVFTPQRSSVVWLRVSSVEPKNVEAGARTVRFGVTRAEATAIVDSVGNVVEAIPVREMIQDARYLERNREVKVLGTTNAFPKVTAVVMSRGRFLSESDSRDRESVAVIGWDAAKYFFPNTNPLGKAVRIGRHFVRIVGVLTEEGTSEQAELGNAIIVPIETMRTRFGDIVFERNRGSFKASQYELTRLELILKDATARAATEADVKELLARQHNKTSDVQVAAFEAPRPNPPKNQKRQGRKQAPVLEQGVLESARTFVLVNPLPGQSKIVRLAPEGQAVRKGDVVAELQNAAAKSQLSQLQIQQAHTESRLVVVDKELSLARELSQSAERTSTLMLEVAELEKQNVLGARGEHAVEVKSTTREVEAAEAELAFAKQMTEAANDADKSAKRAEAKLRMAQAQSRLGNAKDRLAMLLGPTKALREKAIELQMAETSAAAKTLIATRKQEVFGSEAELVAVKQQMAVIKQQLDALKGQVKASSIAAPIDGVLLYETLSRARSSTAPIIGVGADVRERQPLVRVADPKVLQVRVRVHESKIRRVRVGQGCEVVVDALPGEKLKGTVKSVAKTPVRGLWPNPDLKEYITVVSVEPLESLVMGMTCEVTFKD